MKLPREPRFVIDGAGERSADSEHRRSVRKRLRGGGKEVRVSDHRAGSAVLQDVAELVRGEVPIERAVIEAAGPAGVDDIDIDRVVAQKHRHHVAFAKTERGEPAGETPAAVEQEVGRSLELAEAQRRGHDAASGSDLRWALSFSFCATMRSRASRHSASPHSKYCLK
jgi:hypothetical protein